MINQPIKEIDWRNHEITVKGGKTAKLNYDKLLVAWGSHKKRLKQEYTNVHYLEDRISHERCSKDILKAKTVVVFGGTMDAYQTACSVREQLDSVGMQKSQVVLMHTGHSEA